MKTTIFAVSQPGTGLERQIPGGGLRGLIASRLLAWQERRYAARRSLELLALYRRILAEYPGLDDREYYKLLVMARKNCDSKTADQVLDSAEESFATWPVMRKLTLCDVIHYLAVSESIPGHDGQPWVISDFREVVASRIPRDLCFSRRR